MLAPPEAPGVLQPEAPLDPSTYATGSIHGKTSSSTAVPALEESIARRSDTVSNSAGVPALDDSLARRGRSRSGSLGPAPGQGAPAPQSSASVPPEPAVEPTADVAEGQHSSVVSLLWVTSLSSLTSKVGSWCPAPRFISFAGFACGLKVAVGASGSDHACSLHLWAGQLELALVQHCNFVASEIDTVSKLRRECSEVLTQGSLIVHVFAMNGLSTTVSWLS